MIWRQNAIHYEMVVFEQHVTISQMICYGIEIYFIYSKAYEGYLSMNKVICTHASHQDALHKIRLYLF